jgi:glucuronate isomerase
MSTEDGLVMQLHPGVLRPAHTNEEHVPGNGHDLPDYTSYSRSLQPLLRDFGTNRNLHLVLYTVDEAALSREIGPLASTYPGVFAGTPWWFLDSPASIARFRAAVTDTAGFAKTSGFVDDTRAFCSIPARHDISRRADASFLAGLVMTHQISENEAASIAMALVRDIPARTFKLEKYLSSAASLREQQASRFPPPVLVEPQPAMAPAHTSAA